MFGDAFMRLIGRKEPVQPKASIVNEYKKAPMMDLNSKPINAPDGSSSPLSQAGIPLYLSQEQRARPGFSRAHIQNMLPAMKYDVNSLPKLQQEITPIQPGERRRVIVPPFM